MEQAIVAGGCFWCTEAVFRDVIGVTGVESGYIGGEVANPTYKQVCTGNTGHAEGIRVTFDPTVDFVTKLPDGTELTIPGGAANVDSTVTEVRIVITPTAKGLSKSADEKPADYGYSIELFDNSCKHSRVLLHWHLLEV